MRYRKPNEFLNEEFFQMHNYASLEDLSTKRRIRVADRSISSNGYTATQVQSEIYEMLRNEMIISECANQGLRESRARVKDGTCQTQQRSDWRDCESDENDRDHMRACNASLRASITKDEYKHNQQAPPRNRKNSEIRRANS